MDRQQEAIITARSDLNHEYVKETGLDDDIDVEFLVIASTIN